jgi:hypothetical protein
VRDASCCHWPGAERWAAMHNARAVLRFDGCRRRRALALMELSRRWPRRRLAMVSRRRKLSRLTSDASGVLFWLPAGLVCMLLFRAIFGLPFCECSGELLVKPLYARGCAKMAQKSGGAQFETAPFARSQLDPAHHSSRDAARPRQPKMKARKEPAIERSSIG